MLLFALAVASLIALTNLLVLLFIVYARNGNLSEPLTSPQTISTDILLGTSVAVFSVIILASLFKLLQLSRGGRVIAEALGGKRIPPNTDHPDERRVRNVVEEMAIAAGMPVPAVYLFEEQGINAFAAGYKTSEAVIGVSRGCVNLLDRDELQGVVAHEFSHILHGDMRLNIRLMGVLHGILVIGILGHYLLRMVSRSGFRRRSGKNDLALPFLLVGGGLAVIGYTGTFFGNLIKAAVSRQREFLADASAVRYTRNLSGISGALKKIGGYTQGSKLEHPKAAEMSHLFFGQAVSPFFNIWMATHPPLDQRIRRIDPQWNGRFPKVERLQSSNRIFMHDLSRSEISQIQPGSHMEHSVSTDTLLASVGELGGQNLSYATKLLAELPAQVLQASHDPFSARALIYCLMLDRKPAVELKQWQLLERDADSRVINEMKRLNSPRIRQPKFRLSLIEICLPALEQLSGAQYQQFKANLTALIKADQAASLFEWAAYRIITGYLEPGSRRGLRYTQIGSLKSVTKAAGLIVSAVAAAGGGSDGQVEQSFNLAKRTLGLPRMQFVAQREYELRDLSRALAILDQLKPLAKPKLLKALYQCVAFDGQIEPIEAELLRAISMSLDCPMPPIQNIHADG